MRLDSAENREFLEEKQEMREEIQRKADQLEFEYNNQRDIKEKEIHDKLNPSVPGTKQSKQSKQSKDESAINLQINQKQTHDD